MRLENGLAERRNVLARTTLALVNKSTALTPEERSRLAHVRSEMDRLEEDLHDDQHRRHAVAFRNFLRHGLTPGQYSKGISAEDRALVLETRDMGTGGGAAGIAGTAAGGLFVPMQFEAKVIAALKTYAPMLDVATIYDTETGAPRAFPMDNDTSVSGQMLDENQQGNQSDISNISSVVLKSYKFSSQLVKCSIELVEDAGFDLEAYLIDRFAIRLSRVMNTKLTLGAGSTEPYGIVTQAAIAGTATGAFSNDGVSGANTIGSDDLAALEQSVDPAYRNGALYMCHSNTLAALRKVKDKSGRPIFFRSGETINGYGVVVNNNMDQLQANVSSPPVVRNTVAFGALDQFIVRKTPLMVWRLVQRFADQGLVAFMAMLRADSAIADGGGGAIKLLQNVY